MAASSIDLDPEAVYGGQKRPLPQTHLSQRKTGPNMQAQERRKLHTPEESLPHHLFGPDRKLLRRLKKEKDVPPKRFAPAREQFCRAEEGRRMPIMPAGVPLALRPGSTGRTGFLPNRKGVQIGPQSNGGSGQATAEQGRRAGRQKMEEAEMSSNVRPESMERITTPALANAFIAQQIEEIRAQVGSKKVLLALSGGVDSSVVAALLIKAIGKQLVCVHVNHGLLRKGEPEQVVKVFRDEMDANLIYVDAVDRFLDKLAGVSDPETKRKIIGKEFIEVFNDEAKKLEGIDFLAQGTIYPDILESHGVKAHHNVGGLPEGMTFELVEPVKLLFKDEVRVVGEALGLPHSMVYRQPFPGPGLGVRCLGAITRDRLEALREADAILREEFDKNGLAGKVWQYFIAVPDMKSVGVKDGKRYEGWPAIIRAVNTTNAMTATIEEIPYSLLHHITARITHEVDGINRVVLDLTPKPTGTIEWE